MRLRRTLFDSVATLPAQFWILSVEAPRTSPVAGPPLPPQLRQVCGSTFYFISGRNSPKTTFVLRLRDLQVLCLVSRCRTVGCCTVGQVQSPSCQFNGHRVGTALPDGVIMSAVRQVGGC